MRDLIGSVLGERYQLLELIGEGGMGHVFLAEHVTLKRRVAVKVLREELALEPANVERFLQEAQAASAINHPNVVDVTDFGQAPQGVVYFVMEHLVGEELTAMMHRHGTLPWPSVQAIGLQIVRGLHAAHGKGVVYRDLKPANVYLTRDPSGSLLVKLLDFGIAKHTGMANRPMTKPNSVFGTARYMSPEQAAGKSVDARSDIYATGVVLYEMLTGRAPFESDNYMEVVRCHVNDPIPPLREVAPDALIPDFVESLVMRALEKDPAGRYHDMAEFEAAMLGASIEATRASTTLTEGGGADSMDAIDRTFIWDAEQGRAAREAASRGGGVAKAGPARSSAPAAAPLPAPDNVDATVMRQRPDFPDLPPPPERPVRREPLAPPRVAASAGPSVRKHTVVASHAPSPGAYSQHAHRPAQAQQSAPQSYAQPASQPAPHSYAQPASQPAPHSYAQPAHAFAASQAPAPPPMQDSPAPIFGSTASAAPADPLPRPEVRPGDAAFFANAGLGDASGMGAGRTAAVIPRASGAPAQAGSSPHAHQTLPPVNWQGAAPANPATGGHERADGSPTEEFALRLPRHAPSRNRAVIIVAIVAVLLVGVGVAAWSVFFVEEDTVGEDFHSAIAADQIGNLPLDGKKKKKKEPEIKSFKEEDAEKAAEQAPPSNDYRDARPRPSPPSDPSGAEPDFPDPEPFEPEPEPFEPEPEPEPIAKKPRKPRRGGGGGGGGGKKSVKRGFDKARRTITQCGATHGAIEGTAFNVAFDVAGGRAINVKVPLPHSVTSVGRCVAKAIEEKARFKGSDASGQSQRVKF